MSKEKYSAKKASRIRKALKTISGLNSFIYKISNGKRWGKWAGKYPIMGLSVFVVDMSAAKSKEPLAIPVMLFRKYRVGQKT